jgi:hypothetical protein
LLLEDRAWKPRDSFLDLREMEVVDPKWSSRFSAKEATKVEEPLERPLVGSIELWRGGRTALPAYFRT